MRLPWHRHPPPLDMASSPAGPFRTTILSMLFRQLFDLESSTYTYLLADEPTRQALLIDPVFAQFERDRALVRELGLALRYTLETHVHADHVTAAWRLHDALGSQIVLSKRSGAEGADLYVDDGDTVGMGAAALGTGECHPREGGPA